MKRMAAVAGQFYFKGADKLSDQVSSMMEPDAAREPAIAIMSPHAGLMYSGGVAGAVYSRIKAPKSFILIGPNHTGLGAMVSMMPQGEWEIPTGTFKIDESLAQKILKHAPMVSADTKAHLYEHSLEVQLPFIAHIAKDAMIVPITVMSASLGELKEIGHGISHAVKESGHPVLIVASSDMSHFIPDGMARKKDKLAIDRVTGLDPDGLYKIVQAEDISMCGYMPTVIMLSAAKELGARSAELVKYATSGDVSGDYDSVVGYAGVIIR